MKKKYGFCSVFAKTRLAELLRVGLLSVGLCGLVSATSLDSVASPTKQIKQTKPIKKGKPVFIPEEEPQLAPQFYRESKWNLFGGFDLGFSKYSPYQDSTTEASRSGVHLGIRGLLARYWNKWVLDGGLGLQLISNSGKNSDGTTNKVTTRNAYLDLSPRYRFDRHWQFGPEVEFWLGTDKGLNPSIFSEDSNNGTFAGLQVIYEWMDPRKYRLGARWLTGLNAEERSVHVFQAFFQIGFSVFDSKNETEPEEIEDDSRYRPVMSEQVDESDFSEDTQYTAPADPLPLETPAPEKMPEQAPTQKTAALVQVDEKKNTVMMTLDVKVLPFAFDSARMPKYNADRVREIGRFLGERKNTWKSLTVVGHTDERGEKKYNYNLSQARAETVRQLLVEGGAPSNKIKIKGRGSSQPKDKRHNESAWTKNRRVELDFQGVKDLKILKEGLEKR